MRRRQQWRPRTGVAGWIQNQVRTAKKKINTRRRRHRNISEHRYRGVSLDELWERVSRFQQQLGRFDGIRIQPLSGHIYRIEA